MTKRHWNTSHYSWTWKEWYWD